MYAWCSESKVDVGVYNDRMYTVVGLRNPGDAYRDTRHNAGAIAVTAFCEAYGFPPFVYSARYSGDISEGVIDGKNVRLLLPNIAMNVSGSSVKKTVTDAKQLIVVYDELDLPLGKFKLSFGRGSGGHNGVASVINALGSKEFMRVRIGISPRTLFGSMKKPPSDRVSKFVLQNFTRRERAKLDALLPHVTKAIETIVTKGREAAMNEFNER